MLKQMIIADPAKNTLLGRLEYDCKQDVLLLNEGAAKIYYGEQREKRVSIEDFFGILSAKSSQALAKVLTNSNTDEHVLFQRVYCNDGCSKKVLLILFSSNFITDNRFLLCVDVTKTV